ncbi:MAG: hypothetical protein IPJ24_16645 [bacterium]|nr:hypothetical protein [bacterium]
MLAVLATAALLPLAGCGKKPQQEVWIIGLDGGDWDIIEPVMNAGRMPNPEEAARRGRLRRLRSEMPLSPVLWTSIATGQTPIATA